MPSKPSRAKYLIVIDLPHRVGPEPLPRTGPWRELLTPWKDGGHRRDPVWLRELPQAPFLLAAVEAPGLGVLLEKKNSNS